MLKTNTQIKKVIFTAIFAIFMIPTIASADYTGSFGSDSWGGGGLTGWGGDSYGYDYSPNYSYTPSYGSYSQPSYGSYSYPSYGSYAPSYGSSYGSSYVPSYSSSIPSSNYVYTDVDSDNKNKNKNKNKNTSTASSSANASSSNVNINNNNVYVYTKPSGNAVVYNPDHQNLNVYCVITPSNPRVGQTVTATAYATGGTGNYSYTWGGDINSTSGASTSFTSYTTGTKSITITARSGQEVKTATCNVTFENSDYNNDLSVACYATPSTATINQIVTWRATVNGGNGYYTYNWYGTDGLSGGNSIISKQYSYAGTKTATLTVTSGGRTITTNCSVNIVGNTYIPSYTSSSVDITRGTPISGVYLSQLPATGLSLSFVHYMIGIMVLILATVFTFIVQARKRLLAEEII